MLTRYSISNNALVESTDNAAGVLVAIAPGSDDMKLLQSRYTLDDYDLASALDPDEVPRLDAAKDRLFLIWKVPESAVVSESIELGVKVVGVALLDDEVGFIRGGGAMMFGDREFRHPRDARDVMLAFLLRTVRHFVGHLKVIRQISGELERKITVSMENRHLLQMFALSESLVYYMDAIEGNGAVLSKLRNIAEQHGFGPEHIETLDDVILENAQASRQAAIFSSVLSGLMDARGTVVNNNMNVLLKNLTLINIVFLPLNLIASIGGMSEWSMMTRRMDWPLAYLLFCVGMVVLGWGTWLFMKRIVERGAARAASRQR